jgi:drug/metabolite transporter (DMT)-like permease
VAHTVTTLQTHTQTQVKLTGGRVPVLQLCVLRSSLSLATSMGVGTASRIKPLLGHRARLPLLFMRGLFGTAAICCSYFAVLNLPLGDAGAAVVAVARVFRSAAPALASCAAPAAVGATSGLAPPHPACAHAVTLAQTRPPITAIMAWLLLSEPLGWRGLGGCLISLCGAALIAHPPFLFGGHADWGTQRLLGTACGLASPLFGAGVSCAMRRVSRQEPALVVALWFPHRHAVCAGLAAARGLARGRARRGPQRRGPAAGHQLQQLLRAAAHDARDAGAARSARACAVLPGRHLGAHLGGLLCGCPAVRLQAMAALASMRCSKCVSS